uniref:Uncharacterized protein n=1 Tax=viral metagenome TaxID=1070528 RepID=A0A6C0EFH5_9ZZZZ
MVLSSTIIKAWRGERLKSWASEPAEVLTSTGTIIDNIILTTHHGIKNAHTVQYEKDGIMQNCKVFSSIEQYDIGILTLDDFVTFQQIKTLIKTIDYVRLNELKKGKYIVINDFCVHSRLYPRIPVITVDESYEQSDSGKMIYHEEKMLGMIISKDTRVNILPYEIILTIIDKFINNNIISIPLNCSICDIDINEDGNISYALILNDDSVKLLNGKKPFYFKKDDVIISIDNKEFNKDGMIISDNINKYVYYDTYLLLNLNTSSKIKFYRNNELKSLTINYVNINDSIYQINISDNNIKCDINGFKFCELSEDMIMNYYSKKHIKIINKYYYLYASNDEKLVVMYGIDPEKVKIFNETFDGSYIEDNLVRKFLVVSKVGNKKINGIEDMLTIKKNINKTKIITFIDADMTEYKMTI